MSRQMKREEIAAFEAKYGYKPTEIKVALDAVAFFVNKNNPIQALTLAQIDSIFPPLSSAAAPTSPTGAMRGCLP